MLNQVIKYCSSQRNRPSIRYPHRKKRSSTSHWNSVTVTHTCFHASIAYWGCHHCNNAAYLPHYTENPLFTRYRIVTAKSSRYSHNHQLSTLHPAGNHFLYWIQHLHLNIVLHLLCQHHPILYPNNYGLWHGPKHHIWHESQSGQWSVTSRLISHIWDVAANPFFNTGLVSWWVITLCAAWLAWSTCWQLNWGSCWGTYLRLILLVQKKPFLQATIYFLKYSKSPLTDMCNRFYLQCQA